jgi:ferritin-like metal-binding protein YciE
MAGLIVEGKKAIEEDMKDEVKDAALIAAAQRVEHYEIAAYGTVKSMASLLDEEEAAGLLDETLSEEKETDQLLTEISEDVNARAEGERTGDADKNNMKPMRRTSSGAKASTSRQPGARSASKRKR